jgi:DUF1680 family protein
MIAALDVRAPADPLPISFEVTPLGTKPATPVMYWDSDLGKWIEAAAYTLATHRDPMLETQIDDVVDRIAAAQEPYGYFNSYFQRRAPEQRFTNLRDWHELYCAGHLIEGAVAYAAATGKRKLLEVMSRYVDLMVSTFGTGLGMKRGYCGHEEIELALVKLYRFTGERRYLDLARCFVNERGAAPHYFAVEARERGEPAGAWYHKTFEYNQSHRPVREQDKVVGHAVRAMYLYSAMADIAAEDDDAALRTACERLWHDLTAKRLYVTGGLGPSWSNEGFTRDYDLPNETAYAETCAAVGLVFWAHRMLLMTGDAQYADIMERALYNGAVSGISLGGDRFFYENPLASRGDVQRWEWHRCPCCPANIARLVASVGQYVASAADNALSLHLYAQGDITAQLGDRTVALRIDTRFPWDGDVCIRVNTGGSYTLRLRVPDWCPTASVSVNGQIVTGTNDRGYLRIERDWLAGDEARLSLAMPARWLSARPELVANLGRVALQRGPFIYCIEEADTRRDAERLLVDARQSVELGAAADELGGAVTLQVRGWLPRDDEADGRLYRAGPPDLMPTMVRAIPYPLWAHRGPGSMAVWLRSHAG